MYCIDPKICDTRKYIGGGNNYICDHNNLKINHPGLIKEWHPNNEQLIESYSSSSHKKVKWICLKNPCGCHIWEAMICSRTGPCKTGCPFCANKKLCDHNNLLATNPELIKEWHPDNEPMQNYFPSSHKTVKWVCSKNSCGCHTWESSINNRTAKNGRDCPFCLNKKLCDHNNLFATNPELVGEWHHDNGSMKDYPPHSNKKVKWICLKNSCGCHIWEASINSRTGSKSGCPFCYGHEPCEHNNLAVTNPELIKEWHPDNKPIENYLRSSGKRVKWICSKNSCGCHIWNASIYSRTGKKKHGCPFCVNQKPCDHNNLFVANPELIKEWHHDNGSMKMYLPGSDKKVKWICPKNICGCHIWKAKISSRTKKRSGCPFCYGHKPCKHNNLPINNPGLIKEWHHDNNPMENYSQGSEQKVKWVCSKNQFHIWEASIKNRTGVNKTGCPKCKLCPSCTLWRTNGKLCVYCKPKSENKLYQKTKEMTIVKYLKDNLPDEEFIHNKSVGKDCTEGHLFPDILFKCSYYNIIVEIDEFKHRGASYACDKQRMYDIIAKLGNPCIFIRYNPDHKDSDKEALLEHLQEYLEFQYDDTYFEEGNYIWDDYGFDCQYLYYY